MLHKKNTFDLTATSNYRHISVDTNDNEEYDFTKYQMSTTDDEENDETEDLIDTAKPSPSDAAQIETDLTSPISALPIVAIKVQIFQVLMYLPVYH